ncbi:hypothetical protein SNEBB_005120 [Seison nebaliae]|nr:hypothetical protein SNEBB_005120 [Seison nebaliae]
MASTSTAQLKTNESFVHRTESETWQDVKRGINDVFSGRGITANRYMELYTIIYYHCTVHQNENKYLDDAMNGYASNSTIPSRTKNVTIVGGEDLYIRIKIYFEHRCKEIYQKTTDIIGNDELLLTYYNECWRNYLDHTSVVSGFSSYVSKHYVEKEEERQQRNSLHPFNYLSLLIWAENILQPLHERLTNACLKLIKDYRQGEKDEQVLQIVGITILSYIKLDMAEKHNRMEAIKMIESFQTEKRKFNTTFEDDEEIIDFNQLFEYSRDIVGKGRLNYLKMDLDKLKLTNYHTYFEQAYMKELVEFYKTEATYLLTMNPVREYLIRVEDRLTQEMKIAAQILHHSTGIEVKKKTLSILIEKEHETMKSEFIHFLENSQCADLRRMTLLISEIPSLMRQLYILMKEHIDYEGKQCLSELMKTDSGDAIVYIEKILAIHAKYMNIIQTAFDNQAEFLKALDIAFNEFVNFSERHELNKMSGLTRSPENLAKFCDNYLKKGALQPVNSTDNLQETLSNVMTIFTYLKQRDIFMSTYMKAMEKRLIFGQTIWDDAEEEFIKRLKETCGFEYTQKIARMLNDKKTSETLDVDFKKEHRKDLPIPNFMCYVLSSNSWSLQLTHEFQIPDDLQKCVGLFENFYLKKKNGRKLVWLYNFSKGEIVANCFKNKNILHAYTYQISILYLYNKNTVYTFDEIKNEIKMGDDLLTQALDQLTKCKILRSCQTQSGTQYHLNTDFKTKKIKMNIMMQLKNESKNEVENQTKSLENDRKHLVQATIVRIMKAKKRFSQDELINYINNQVTLTFQANTSLIIKCIEILIDKEYMCRDPTNAHVFLYIA